MQLGVLAKNYVLMTAAHNEEAFIEETIASVLSQTIRPQRWVIVSDGSTDKTNEIVQHFAEQYNFILFLKLERPPGRNFGSKGRALEQGCKLLAGASYEFIGNLDADIALEPCYFEELLKRFGNDPQLGIAAGFIYEQQNGKFCARAANRVDSVPHAAQLLRRGCYEAIKGYAVFKYGGEDWYAQQSAKMKGWSAEAFPDLKIFHERHTGAAGSLLKHQFRLGRLDYSFGSDPFFECMKCGLRIFERPWLLGAAARLTGFAWSGFQRESRPVSQEFVEFIRKEQRAKVIGLFRGTARERLLTIR